MYQPSDYSLLMGSLPPATRVDDFRWADFLALDEDDSRELVHGELTEVEVPTELHEYIVAYLIFRLFEWAKRSGGGRALASGYKIRIDDRRGVMPDVQFYRPDNLAKRDPTGLTEGRPDLVVEVVSESSIRHDRVFKLGCYLDREIPEYWIIDPVHETVEQLILANGRYTIATSLAGDALFRPDTFPGLEIALTELWSAD